MITEKQKQERRHHLGSSDIAAVLGLASKWRGPHEVWASKVLEIQDSTNAAQQRGISMEPLILDWVEQDQGIKLERAMRFTSTEHPEFAANLDGWCIDKKLVVEVKSIVSTDDWDLDSPDGVPVYYIAQVQHQMYCAEAKKALVVAVQPSLHSLMHQPHIFEVQRDNEFIAFMVESGLKFWRDYVETAIAPPHAPIDLDVYRRIKRPANAGEPMQAAHAGIYTQLIDASAQRREAEAREDQLKAQLLALYPKASALLWQGKKIFSTVTSKRLDTKKLLADHPEIDEEKYRTESTSIRFASK